MTPDEHQRRRAVKIRQLTRTAQHDINSGYNKDGDIGEIKAELDTLSLIELNTLYSVWTETV